MTTGDSIGLLPGFGWIANISTGSTALDWFLIYLVFLAIVPIGPSVIQFFIMGDPVSFRIEDNYLSFIVGDWFLGVCGANLVLIGRLLPPEQHWYNNRWFHLALFGFAFLVMLTLCWLDTHGGGYTLKMLLYPPKLYHNVLVYWVDIYLLLSCVVAAFAAPKTAAWWVLLVIAVVFFAIWAFTLAIDSSLAATLDPDGVAAETNNKASELTPHDWRFFNGPRRWIEDYYAVPQHA